MALHTCMEYHVVTKIKSSDVIKKTKAIAAKGTDSLKKISTVKVRTPRKTAAAKAAVKAAGQAVFEGDAAGEKRSASHHRESGQGLHFLPP